MDALTSIFSAARLTGRIECLGSFALPWGVLFEEKPDTPCATLHLVADGGCCLRCGGHLPERLASGDLVLIPSGAAHILSDHPESRALTLSRALDRNAALLQTHMGPTATVMTVSYSQDMVAPGSILAALPEPMILRADQIAKNPQLHLLVELIRTEAAASGTGAGLVLPRLLDSLLALTLRVWVEAHGTDLPPSWLKGLTDPGIAQMLDDIHAHPGDNWTLRTMSLSAGLARATFARRFGEMVGQTPMAYLNHWRMILAAHRIKDGELSVEAAAQTYGYSSAAAFSRAFRRDFGMAPSRLRRPARPEADLATADLHVLPVDPAPAVAADDSVVMTPPAFMTRSTDVA
ncbi:AraC family transcriptional regulator [Pseudaestuariivita atlantica]|uniref:HTH araC/xylS-type domain-containing protein n=1 Tax=Pseudaestuariivita atlantica TaxID=1317121 RepID=A0A0L1JSD2_9RHOB|nr:AraC family transcriptional regulator [Pseudaestuariivita atlantica]KNG94665.1 hypothetical protein ATO11_04500 [Pseudaestuariivita atlantica]